MANQKLYRAPDLDVEQLANAISSWLQPQDYEMQTFPSPGGVTLQARHTSWIQRGGGGVALNIVMMKQGENLQVQIGTSKWAMQAVSGVAAAILFWPLLALPAYAAYKQKEIIDDAWQFIDQYVATGGQVPLAGVQPMASVPAAASAQTMACPSCGKPVRADAKFCDNCGAKLTVTCAKCGATLRSDAKFCDKCGAPVEAS